MAVNGITANITETYQKTTVSATSVKYSASSTITGEAAGTSKTEDAAAVYEKSDSAENAAEALKKHKIDFETLDQLKADAERRTSSLRSLVEKMLLKQGSTFEEALGLAKQQGKGLAEVYRNLEVPKDVQEQAQKDIAEDGYWGIEQTSDRILSFAKALAGDNVEYANQMLDAIKKGFEQAGVEWGEDLPDISKQTMETTLTKVNDWISSLSSSNTSDYVADQITGQAAAAVQAVEK